MSLGEAAEASLLAIQTWALALRSTARAGRLCFSVLNPASLSFRLAQASWGWPARRRWPPWTPAALLRLNPVPPMPCLQRLAPGWLPTGGLRLLTFVGPSAAPATAAAALAATVASDAAVHSSHRGMEKPAAAEEPAAPQPAERSELPVSSTAGAAAQEREGLLESEQEEEERTAAGYDRLPSVPAPMPSGARLWAALSREGGHSMGGRSWAMLER